MDLNVMSGWVNVLIEVYNERVGTKSHRDNAGHLLSWLELLTCCME